MNREMKIEAQIDAKKLTTEQLLDVMTRLRDTLYDWKFNIALESAVCGQTKKVKADKYVYDFFSEVLKLTEEEFLTR